MSFDRILLHPNLAAKPSGQAALEAGEERADKRFLGTVVGAALGGAGTFALNRLLPSTRWGSSPANARRVAALTGPDAVRTAMAIGGGLGWATAVAQRFNDKLNRHAAAAHEFEQQTGRVLPFMERHPYLVNSAPVLAGAAVGALAAPSIGLGRLAGAGVGALASGLTVTPLAANYAQAAREAYFAPYQMGKSAAVLADPRLLHPGLVERPQNIEESATRRGQHLNFAAGGATLGGLAGLAAAHALVRHVPDLAKELGAGTVRAGGGVAGLLGGAALGLGAGALTRAVSRVKKHDEAVHKFEQESGERIPFMARHPYLMTAGPSVLAAAYGLARPHAAVRELARHVGPGTGAGLRVLNAATNASLAGMTAGVLGNALSHNERKHFFQSRVPTLSMDRYGLTATEEVNTAKELEDMHRAMNGEAVEASEAI